ncbi:MAG: elongation factor P maturation arginine rhamnosyltransferase EarP [Planctomycetaceae bacterium]
MANIPSDSSSTPGRWDLFCKVVDNFGDIGVCWRLARQLASEFSIAVRLWVDDLNRFQKLCPAFSSQPGVQRIDSIEIRHWQMDFPDLTPPEVADVVIEAFGCELPTRYVAAMNRRRVAPLWINLEYLSAESWVEECHGLLSPQPHSSLKKYFYFPGFTPQTGGLLREKGLFSEREAFDEQARAEFWDSLGIAAPAADELRISLFCYENNALPVMLNEWATGDRPIGVVATSGLAARQVESWFGEQLPERGVLRRGSLTIYGIPFLSQAGYDRLLWACDINFVRGEDSFVRAQWAQQPFIWQIYPQAEEAHFAKLDAFLNRFLGSYPDPRSIRECFLAWNGKGKMAEFWRKFAENRPLLGQHGKVWARQLDQTGDLANNLVSFVRGN